MTAPWVRPAVSSVAFVFGFVGWLVRMWPTFVGSFVAQVYVLVSCAAIGFCGAWLAGLVVGFAPKLAAAREQVAQARRDEVAYRDLTTIADVVGVLRPGVDR